MDAAARFSAGPRQANSRPRPLLGRARALLRSRDGEAAVEFALVAPMFLALLVAIIESGLIFFAQQALQTAATQSARLIMTGQAQTQNLTAAQFAQTVCGKLPAMFSCANLYVNVAGAATFSAIAPLNPLQSGTLNAAAMSYNPGIGGDIEIVQLFYLWPSLTAPLGLSYADMNGAFLITATAAFRNEPFSQ